MITTYAHLQRKQMSRETHEDANRGVSTGGRTQYVVFIYIFIFFGVPCFTHKYKLFLYLRKTVSHETKKFNKDSLRRHTED